MKRLGLVTLSLALTLAPGCVKRTILIESDPPGAKVWVNEHLMERVTPLEYEFITHGGYKFRLRKAGFREVVAREKVQAPIYQWIPLDLVFEHLVPAKLEDKHVFRYTLSPLPPSEQLQEETPEGRQSRLGDLADPDPERRRAAVFSLARERDPAQGDAALKATGDADPRVRAAGLEALRAIRGPEALERLTEVLRKDPEPEVRWSAAIQLEALHSEGALPALREALQDRDPLVRAGAAEALKGIPDAESVDPLIRALRDKDTATRRAAAEGLGRIGDRAAVRPLMKVLFHHDFQTRRRAAESLHQLKDPAASLVLVRSLHDWDPVLRDTASQAIVEFGDERVVPVLVRYLRSGKPAVRLHAAEILGRMKDPRAVEPLTRAFRREPNDVTSHVMLEALKSLGAGVDPSWEQMDRYRFQEGEKRRGKEAIEQQKRKEQESKEKTPY